MAVVLIDTNVASFLHPRKSASRERALYEPHLLGNTLAISFQTVGELFQWARENQWGPTNLAALDSFIARFVVIPYDIDLARAWGDVMASSKAVGRRLESGDGWIAATALRHRIPLVTHDRDFIGLGIPNLTVHCHA